MTEQDHECGVSVIALSHNDFSVREFKHAGIIPDDFRQWETVREAARVHVIEWGNAENKVDIAIGHVPAEGLVPALWFIDRCHHLLTRNQVPGV